MRRFTINSFGKPLKFVRTPAPSYTQEFIKNNETKIVNNDISTCMKCFHRKNNNTCGKFAEKSLINGELTYLQLEKCRQDKTKCGKKAVFYKQLSDEEYKKRIMYHKVDKVLDNVLTTVFVSGVVVVIFNVFVR